MQKHDAAIAAKAREDVLDELSGWGEENLKGYFGVNMPNRILQSKLQSLRSTKEKQHGN
jgi:hypothetical protein